MNELLIRYEEEEDLAESRRLLAKISLIGTYIKRYGNLIFIGEREAVSDIAELGACLEESFSSLRLMGIECALTAPAGERIYVRDAVRIYSFFESILEACVDSIKFMWVKIRPCGEEMVFCMEVESEDDLNSFFDKTDQGENEDGIWKFTFTIKRQVKSNADVVDDDGVVQSGRCFIFCLLYFYDMRLEKWNWNVFSSFTFVFPVESSGIFVRTDR